MRDKTVGWLFVVAQAVLLIAVVLLPAAEHWSRPLWLMTVAGICVVAGIVIAAVAALGLGTALSATPVPNEVGELQTSGLFALVRHPVYSGIMLAVAGAALRSGNAVVAVVAALTIGFFPLKARWEERRLAQRYPGYQDYAASTPRFVPRPASLWRRQPAT